LLDFLCELAFSTLVLSSHCCSWLQCYVIFVLASLVTVTVALVGFCTCMAELYRGVPQVDWQQNVVPSGIEMAALYIHSVT